MTERVNERGNTITSEFSPGDRYLYDFRVCTAAKGWKQFDTKQDAWYFGVWVHPERRLVFTYAEGDLSLVRCGSEASYHAELASMVEFYGPAPPAFIALDADGTRTDVYDTRPE